ncbi:MAG: hypothetical protein ACYTEV_02385 [Planctomycetota bacterium]|jgi:hypothetical protein
MFEQFNFVKDFHNVTTLHPVGVMAMVAAITSVMLVPRRMVLLPILVIACVMAPAQRVVVLGMDFTFLRLIIAAAWFRVIIRNEHVGFSFGRLDRVILIWAGFSFFAYLMLYPNPASISYQLGVAFDALATYFLVRVIFRELPDITTLARGLAILSVPVAIAMTYERLTGQNLFSVFGGVPEQTLERYGRYRAQAAFSHPIIAGTFWVSLLPIVLAGLRRDAESIAFTIVGVIGSLVIIWCCSSSTPVLLAGLVFLGSAMVIVRGTMRWFRWGVGLGLLALHIVMFPPVWHLFARINFFPGSSGWWRYLIIDRFVQHWDDWVVIGSTRSQGWLPGGTFVDVTNQYVSEGINGGIVKLVLFVTMLVIGFGSIGSAIRSNEHSLAGPRKDWIGSWRTWASWCIGLTICVHAAAYFATAYFGQLVILQYISLALAASLPAMAARSTVRVRTAATGEDAGAPAVAPVAGSNPDPAVAGIGPAWPAVHHPLTGGGRVFRPV